MHVCFMSICVFMCLRMYVCGMCESVCSVCVVCVCGCVWLDLLKVTQLVCESGLSPAPDQGLSKKPQPSSQMLADFPDGQGET